MVAEKTSSRVFQIYLGLVAIGLALVADSDCFVYLGGNPLS
jgi:hypothetical protein